MTENTSLQQKLEQYSTTARGQTTHSLSAAEIAGYAAAGAALTMAGAADAGIVYSGVQNISVQINPNAVATGNTFTTATQTAIDIDGGGADINAAVGLLATLNTTNPTQAKYVGLGLSRRLVGRSYSRERPREQRIFLSATLSVPAATSRLATVDFYVWYSQVAQTQVALLLAILLSA